MKTIGYAVVGTGYFGAELARIMKEQEGARVVAVYDPENAGTVAAELGCDTETDLDRLYSREDVDAVIVASPMIPLAVTRPFSSTVAIFSLLEVQRISDDVPIGSTVAFNCRVSPQTISASS